MIIRKKKIRNIKKYIQLNDVKDIKFIGIRITNENEKKATDIGFSKELTIGEEILPREIGAVTRFNSRGKEIVDRTEKEFRDIYRPYHIKDWHGQYHDGIAHEVRECNKKMYIKPNQVEFKIIRKDEEKYIIAKEILENNLKHILNLFLEIFGECEIIYENEKIDYGNTIRLNWRVLPKGKYPWEKLYPYVKEKLENIKETNRVVARKNIEIIAKYKPSFVAIGEAGFSGYIIFGFEKSDRVILESMEVNNATYILKDDWEEISKMTKAEILQNNLYEKRIIHTKNWETEIEKIIKKML